MLSLNNLLGKNICYFHPLLKFYGKLVKLILVKQWHQKFITYIKKFKNLVFFRCQRTMLLRTHYFVFSMNQIIYCLSTLSSLIINDGNYPIILFGFLHPTLPSNQRLFCIQTVLHVLCYFSSSVSYSLQCMYLLCHSVIHLTLELQSAPVSYVQMNTNYY